MGIRVIKTALAATVAVYLAWLMGLDFYPSAGILAILSVETTRKKNVQSAFQRLMASFVGIAIAAILFETLGYHVIVLGLFIVIAFPLMAVVYLRDGIVTGCVIVFHIFEIQDINGASLLNESLLLLIGIGTATAINLIYMPREDKQMREYKRDIEDHFNIMFIKISEYLREGDSDWNGAEILKADQVIGKGLALSIRDADNKLFVGGSDKWFAYFNMRKEQMESIKHMLNLVAQVQSSLPQGMMLSELFILLGEDIKEDYYTGNTERHLDQLERFFRSIPLPQTRQEFEDRSSLLQLMFEMKRYLAAARKKPSVV